METILIISISFQLLAVFFAIKLIRITGKFYAWILVSLAILLMTIRRIITFIDVINDKIDETAINWPEYTALIISVVLSAGLYLMLPIFRSFKHNEKELDRKNKELLEAKKRAEESDALKTAFIQNLSHEIRTPMNAIMGFTDLLGEEIQKKGRSQEYLTIIRQNGDQLLSIISDLLIISGLATNQIHINQTKVNVNEVIRNLNETFSFQAENQQTLLRPTMPLSDEEAIILSDKIKLTQTLNNLITNALKFTEKGSIEFGYSVKEDSLLFFVKDTGIGIHQDHLEHIFERFRQGHNAIRKKYGGTGLGLSISKAFIEMLGGYMGVSSEYGKGSIFWFTLPHHHKAH